MGWIVQLCYLTRTEVGSECCALDIIARVVLWGDIRGIWRLQVTQNSML